MKLFHPYICIHVKAQDVKYVYLLCFVSYLHFVVFFFIFCFSHKNA